MGDPRMHQSVCGGDAFFGVYSQASLDEVLGMDGNGVPGIWMEFIFVGHYNVY